MASADCFKQNAQLLALKELAKDYPGQTIESVIAQLETQIKKGGKHDIQ